jgi:hypothetical protein
MKKLCYLLGFFFLLSSAEGAIPPNSNGNGLNGNGSNLRSQVDALTRSMNKDILNAKSAKDKYRVMGRTLDEIKSLRDNTYPQSAHDEAYMDLMVDAMESIPPERSFKKRDCARYENNMINEFEPMADEAPQEPAIQPGWHALQSLCR